MTTTKTSQITRNPTDIKDTLDGREARYVAGNGSPDVYYWTPLASDPAPASQINGEPSDDRLHFAGLRLAGDRLQAICIEPNGYWWSSDMGPASP